MLDSKSRFCILIEGTAIAVRVVPHKTDADKLMLKAKDPEGLAALLLMGDVGAGDVGTGSNFYMVEVDKEAFLAALPRVLSAVLDVTVPTADVPEKQDGVVENPADPE